MTINAQFGHAVGLKLTRDRIVSKLINMTTAKCSASVSKTGAMDLLKLNYLAF